MKTLDCKGLNCPEPVLRAKAFLEQGTAEPFIVVVDNEASRENVLRFGRSQGCEVRVAAGGDGSFTISLVPGHDQSSGERFDKADYGCELGTGRNMVYVISSNSMGQGSDELGWALLQTYVTTIAEVSPLPSHILLYNGGVKLVTTKGKALEALQALEKKGVIIWSCGTCLEFFKLEKERQVGSITNMYDIMSTMASAGKLVSPF
ncbi:MAG: sulfurtransferase-like selenium metabolism protein YedF [Proteobacteria bacterium]|nr:sulfurtransferase-like selenium metabolism protein YedF [Pseudomonadota bacterium]MBU1058567.1 sulfurtransferase-like selenium metabolism protein YedF [Pseudomonadota bacterium]